MRWGRRVAGSVLLLAGCSPGRSGDGSGTTSGTAGGDGDGMTTPMSSATSSTTSSEDSSESEASGANSPDSSGEAASTGSIATMIVGGVEKGPFLLGSSVAVSVLDTRGDPSGVVFNTQTLNDRGEFDLVVDALGPVALEGEGFFFNEVVGTLSTAPLTLRAYAEVTGAGTQAIYLNLVTHLVHQRVQTLLVRGSEIDEASAVAEIELRSQLGIGPSTFDPGASGIDMTLLGGDTNANAYALAVGAVALQAAVIEAGVGGPLDATFQQLINTIAADLADDGVIGPAIVADLLAAEQVVDGDAVMASLQARFDEIEATEVVPNIHRVLDQDGDDLANIDDNCWFVANVDQADTDSDGIGDACECGNGSVDPGEGCDDGNTTSLDGCQADCTPTCEIVANLALTDEQSLFGFGRIGEQTLFWIGTGNQYGELWTVDSVGGIAEPLFEEETVFANPAALLAFDGALFFGGELGGMGIPESLWRTDGTELGTETLAVLGESPLRAAVVGSQLFFVGRYPPDLAELFVTDGTAAGTAQVFDIVPGSAGSVPGVLTPMGDEVWFVTGACTSIGQQLWRSDGTAANTTLIDTLFGPLGPIGCPTPAQFPMPTNVGTTYVPVVNDGPHELWSSDGTPAGTFLLQMGASVPAYGAVANGSIFTAASSLYFTDGTVAGTSLLRAFDSAAALAGLGGVGVVWAVDNGTPGLWATDGTAAGTMLITEVGPSIGSWTIVGQNVFVPILGEAGERQMWISDGSVPGTHLFSDLEIPGAPLYNRAVAIDGHLYMKGNDGITTDAWRCISM